MCAPENRGGPRTETRRTKGEFYVGRRRTHGTQRAAPEKRETGWVRESTGCCGKPHARTMNASVSCVAGHGAWSSTAASGRRAAWKIRFSVDTLSKGYLSTIPDCVTYVSNALFTHDAFRRDSGAMTRDGSRGSECRRGVRVSTGFMWQ